MRLALRVGTDHDAAPMNFRCLLLLNFAAVSAWPLLAADPLRARGIGRWRHPLMRWSADRW